MPVRKIKETGLSRHHRLRSSARAVNQVRPPSARAFRTVQLRERQILQREIVAVRARHASRVAELHRDLAHLNEAETPRKTKRENFADAAPSPPANTPPPTSRQAATMRGVGAAGVVRAIALTLAGDLQNSDNWRAFSSRRRQTVTFRFLLIHRIALNIGFSVCNASTSTSR